MPSIAPTHVSIAPHASHAEQASSGTVPMRRIDAEAAWVALLAQGRMLTTCKCQISPLLRGWLGGGKRQGPLRLLSPLQDTAAHTAPHTTTQSNTQHENNTHSSNTLRRHHRLRAAALTAVGKNWRRHAWASVCAVTSKAQNLACRSWASGEDEMGGGVCLSSSAERPAQKLRTWML